VNHADGRLQSSSIFEKVGDPPGAVVALGGIVEGIRSRGPDQ
jgi:hypothetical protein